EYALIHGELGPDHVLVDAQGRPAIIDIEGLMFFDVEWEHAFLEFRFGEHYHHLWHDGLDAARIRFYKLCLHLSLCSGPLRLLDGDFPDRAEMMGIVDWNVAKALEFVR
ncbi:MAG: aminoglycoside phosphotransferase family protein, partial [Chloroflexota bacterium]